jgi:magnesium chelatase subunit H
MAEEIRVAVFLVGSSLPGPLKRAESAINSRGKIALTTKTYNCGAPLDLDQLEEAERDISIADIIFIIHVTDGENARHLSAALTKPGKPDQAVIAFNCMPDLMRKTRMGKLDFNSLMKSRAGDTPAGRDSGLNVARKLGSWMASTFKRAQAENGRRRRSPDQYLKLIGKLPGIMRFVPARGRLADIKNYLQLFCYFLQPTPRNIESMILFAISRYVPGYRSLKVDEPESMPVVGIYHPDAHRIFQNFGEYRRWYEQAKANAFTPGNTLGLLLMRPQIVSESKAHYDALIRAIENEGLAVIPAISTFMDNREACGQFFVDAREPRVSQIVSLTGFSFVGGPAMNDSEASLEFLRSLKVPLRSLVSLDLQTIQNWEAGRLGLNPIQTAMQVAIPEIDGATEPFVFGGLNAAGHQPEPVEERCRRVARRLARWNRLRVAKRGDIRLALTVFCFPPDKGNIGTAADLDVMPSVIEILRRLKAEGYSLDVPEDGDRLRDILLGGNSAEYGTSANVLYRLNVDEYRRLCPYVDDIDREWGAAPGAINSTGSEILILGIKLGNVLIAVQPTFGYEGDPMRLLMAESGAPHHGFMGLYTYLEKVFGADAVIHVGTHGSLEFMPGKQVGLSSKCWPDRLIGELPNIYLYSVNNPAEGTIAKRRSYGELISYLTPPIENAGLYKELSSLKDLLDAYRRSSDDSERARLFEVIEDTASTLHL